MHLQCMLSAWLLKCWSRFPSSQSTLLCRRSVVPVRRGYWGNKIGKPHTVPTKTTGKCGSVTVSLPLHVVIVLISRASSLSHLLQQCCEQPTQVPYTEDARVCAAAQLLCACCFMRHQARTHHTAACLLISVR